MATDYDAPRKTDEEMSEDSLEELKSRRNDKNSGKVDEDEVVSRRLRRAEEQHRTADTAPVMRHRLEVSHD